MDLEKLIKDCEWNIKYHESKIAEEKLKVDAYYTARDAKADNLYRKL